jgi:hypothetical protein
MSMVWATSGISAISGFASKRKVFSILLVGKLLVIVTLPAKVLAQPVSSSADTAAPIKIK